jgi:hypothetical protein
MTWNWYQWDNSESFEAWHSNFIIGKDLGAGSTRYTDCVIDTDNKAKAMVEIDHSEGLVNCEEPSIIRISNV